MTDNTTGFGPPGAPAEIVKQMVAQVCWRVEFSYADVLNLDFGQRFQRTTGPLRGKAVGEYQLRISSDNWALTGSSERVLAAGRSLAAYTFDNSDESRRLLPEYERVRSDALAQLSRIVDQVVTAADVDERSLHLTITFANALRLLVPCEPADDRYNDARDEDGAGVITCWDLYLPVGSLIVPGSASRMEWPLLEVMAGGRWTITGWGGP